MRSSFDKKTAWLLVISIAIGLFVLELGLRLWLNNFAPEHLLARYGTYEMIQKQPLRYSRHPYLSFYPTPNYENEDGDRHNSLGYRGEEITQPKPAGTYRIVAIGGSTTYTASVPTYQDSYPYLLEQELHERGFTNVEVVNGGVPYYDSWPILVNFEFRVLDLDPDLIIYYEGDNEEKTRMVYPHEAYVGDNTGRVSAVAIPKPSLIDMSVALRMLYSRFGEISHYGDLTRINGADTLVHFDYLEQIADGSYPHGLFETEDALDILENNPPIYTKRNLENIVAIAREQGVDVMFATYAYSPVEGERTSTPVYERAIEEHNAVTKEVATIEHIMFYDFASEMSPDEKYWIGDGVHVNEDGSALKAKLFADFLSTRLVYLLGR